jgi:hypothetical protein
MVNQFVKLKKPISVIYEGRTSYKTISVIKVYVLRSGKISQVIDVNAVKYDMFFIEDKEEIYIAVLKQLMYGNIFDDGK